MIIEKPERRARSVAVVGLVFQVLLSVFLVILCAWSRSQSILATTQFSVVGILIWVLLLLVYHQRKLVQDEDFELEQLRQGRGAEGSGEALFDTEGERLLLARRRLVWMYRWILPLFTVLTVGGLLVASLWLWWWGFGESLTSANWREVRGLDNGVIVWFLGGSAFLSFLLSRYVVGMARHSEWRMLRAGSSYLMGVTLSLVATGAVLAVLVFTGNPVPERVLALVLRVLMLVLAGEAALNFVMDFYRPRSPGEEPRPSFDSRFLGLFSEPGGIARSIAEAINYQFGFDVSSTWFYQLLQRSVVPLIGFAIFTLIGASCLVFVDAGEQAVIEHFGQKQALVGPGLHVKWPWPADVAYKVAVDRIHELKIGVSEKEEEAVKKDELILWTNKHAQEPHLMVLLATPELAKHLENMDRGTATQAAAIETGKTAAVVETAATRPAGGDGQEMGKAVPVSMLRVAASIQYKVRDTWDWLTRYENPEKMLETIANREIMKHCASADVMGLMGSDRGQIEADIWKAIQASCDNVKLGVEVKFFGLQGVHPPEKLGTDFQKVISAEHEKIASINSARAEANKLLTAAAGDVNVSQAKVLAEAIAEMNRLADSPAASKEERAAVEGRVRELFMGDQERQIRPIGGLAAVRMANARAKRWQLENGAASEAAAFEQQIAVKNAAPNVFKMRKYLEKLAASMGKARKYIIAVQGRYELPLFQINLQDPLTAPLDTAVEAPKP